MKFMELIHAKINWALVGPRKKIPRYFGDISPKYRVFDTIFHGEISAQRYFGIYREKSVIWR